MSYFFLVKLNFHRNIGFQLEVFLICPGEILYFQCQMVDFVHMLRCSWSELPAGCQGCASGHLAMGNPWKSPKEMEVLICFNGKIIGKYIYICVCVYLYNIYIFTTYIYIYTLEKTYKWRFDSWEMLGRSSINMGCPSAMFDCWRVNKSWYGGG